MKIIGLILLVIIFCISQVSCKKTSSGEVIVYTTVDRIFSEPILKGFEKQTGIKVKAIFDTEETKSTGVLNRLIAEINNPQCDVFWSGDPVRAIILKKKGITAPYNSPKAADIDVHFKDKDFHWTGFSSRARVLIYNTSLVKPKDVPHSIFDLTKEKYKGQVAIANPLFGTTSFHFAAWFTSLGDARAKQFLNNLKNNNVVIASSNGDVKKRVVQGELMCGLTDTDDAFMAKKQGAPVDYLFLDQENLGNLIIPNTVSIIKRSPNLKNARRILDYLLTRKTQARLAVSCAQMPLSKGVKTSSDIPLLDNILPMKINYEETAAKLEKIQLFLKSWAESSKK